MFYQRLDDCAERDAPEYTSFESAYGDGAKHVVYSPHELGLMDEYEAHDRLDAIDVELIRITPALAELLGRDRHF